MFNILDFGAAADGKTLCTGAIQKAADSCRENGGIVYIPFGIYVSGTIHLSSNTHFVFEPGAKILGSSNVDDFDSRESPDYPLYQDASHSYFHRSLFCAENCRNITFSGLGTIDMQDVWEEIPVPGEGEWNERRANKIFAFKNCRDISITDLTLLNSTDLAVYLAGCENVKISKLTLDVGIDGISPDCCKNVTISDCIIRSGDDGIVLKSSYTLGKKQLCENIVITNCTVTSRCSAIKLGTESNGGFKSIVISNCVVYDTFYGALSFEITDGGDIDGIIASNITMRNVGYPLFIILSDRRRGPSDTTHLGTLKNIIVENITASGPYTKWMAPRLTSLFDGETEAEAQVMPCTITGQPNRSIENITLSNIYITVPGGVTADDRNVVLPEITNKYPENYMFGERFPAYGMYFRHVKNLNLKNINIDTLEPDQRHKFVFDDVENLSVE